MLLLLGTLLVGSVKGGELYLDAEGGEQNFQQAMKKFTGSFSTVPMHSVNHFLHEYDIVFPTERNIEVHNEEQMDREFESARITVHSEVLIKMHDYLQMKKHSDFPIDQDVYGDMNIADFITRLFVNRPLAFYYKHDTHVIKERGYVKDGARYMTIGTEDEQYPYVLRNYLSYEEIMFSAMCGLSSLTHYVNDCARPVGKINQAKQFINAGEPNGHPFQATGVIHGLVGARLAHGRRMEALAILKGEPGEPDMHGLPPQLADLFEVDNPNNWETVEKPVFTKDSMTGERTQTGSNTFTVNYRGLKTKQRIASELFVFDAIRMAKREGKRAFLHVIGLGTGEWAVDATKVESEKYIVDATLEAVNRIPDAAQHISTIDFAWFSLDSANGETDNGVNWRISQFQRGGPIPRNTATKVDDDELLVSMYAWDGNSFPGNEWYLAAYFKAHPEEVYEQFTDELDRRMGMWLFGSGDSATATCSSIPLVHNPIINKKNINGRNAKVYCPNGDFVTLGRLIDDVTLELNMERLFHKCGFEQHRDPNDQFQRGNAAGPAPIREEDEVGPVHGRRLFD